MTKKIQKLFEPIKIGKVTVKNRIAMAPMTTLYAGHDGQMTDQCIEYYAARAKGCTGLVTVEGAYINPEGLQIPNSISVCDDIYIPGLSRLAAAIKLHGAISVLQIIHAGIQAWLPQTVGPSAIGRIYGKPISTELVPRELTTLEVEQYVEDFANACFRAKMAGFDMVQIHGTHGYLVHQFLSPLTNKRTDKYGQDRDLFAIEIVQAVKNKCGQDYPVIFRLCADESLGQKFLSEGISIDDAKKTAVRLQMAGVDAFEVTGGQDDNVDFYVPSAYVLENKEGWYFHLAPEIKNVVNVPVISGGAMESPEFAEKAIQDGIVDMVFLGRQLIADSEWAMKIEEGRIREIRPCVKCVECGDGIVHLQSMYCAINPLVGMEYKYTDENDIPYAKVRKRLLVIGAGPGGLECARTAALRGHSVTIVDKNSKIGGTINVAAAPSFKYRYSKLINWYEVQLKKLGVNIITDLTANSELIKDMNSDVVVFATGSEAIVPDIPGIEKSLLSDDVLLGKVNVGNDVIVIGGGLIGCETALYLAKQNKKVTILEVLPELELASSIIGIAMFKPDEGLFIKHGIEINLGSEVVEVGDGVVITTNQSGAKISITADSIINAVGRRAVLNSDIIDEVKQLGRKFFVLGDAKAPRKVKNAVHEGFMTALDL